MKKAPDCNLGNRPYVIRVGNTDPTAGVQQYVRLTLVAKIAGVALAAVVALFGGYNAITSTYHEDMSSVKESMVKFTSQIAGIIDKCEDNTEGIKALDIRTHDCEKHLAVIHDRDR